MRQLLDLLDRTVNLAGALATISDVHPHTCSPGWVSVIGSALCELACHARLPPDAGDAPRRSVGG